VAQKRGKPLETFEKTWAFKSPRLEGKGGVYEEEQRLIMVSGEKNERGTGKLLKRKLTQ